MHAVASEKNREKWAAGRPGLFAVQWDKRLFICPRAREKSKPFRPCVQTSPLYATKKEERGRKDSIKRAAVSSLVATRLPEKSPSKTTATVPIPCDSLSFPCINAISKCWGRVHGRSIRNYRFETLYDWQFNLEYLSLVLFDAVVVPTLSISTRRWCVRSWIL